MTRKHRHDGPSVLKDAPHEQSVAQRAGQVWDCSFLAAATSDGKHIEILAIMDVQTRECLAVLAEHEIGSQEVTDRLFDLFVLKGTPECIRSGNAPIPLTKAIGDWLSKTGVTTRFVKREKSRRIERAESLDRRLRDEIIDRVTFADLAEAKITIEGWRKQYNQTQLPRSAGDEAGTSHVPPRQSYCDCDPDLPQVFRRQNSLEGGGSQSARSHDPLHDENEASQPVQLEVSLDQIETGQSAQRQESLAAIGSGQSAERQAIETGQSARPHGSLGVIETGQSAKRQGSLDHNETSQSVQQQRSLGVIETGQTDECQGSLLAIGTGQSIERQEGTPDDVEIGLSVQRDGSPDDTQSGQSGQSGQRRDEIEIKRSVGRQGPLDEILTGQPVQCLWPLDETGASPFVHRRSPLDETEPKQAVRCQGPLDEIPTGQSVQHRDALDDEARTRRQGRSRRAVAAVIGLVTPSLRPAPSRRRGRPTARDLKRTVVRATEWVGIAVVILLAAVVALTLIAPYFGWRVDTVRSGSMEPELKVGSVIITRPVDIEEIGMGDVITFRSPTSGEIVSHRVSAIEDGPSFRTESTANGDADPFVTPGQSVVGRVCFHLPVAGYVIQRLVTPVGILLLFVFGFSIVASEMISMFQLRWKQSA